LPGAIVLPAYAGRTMGGYRALQPTPGRVPLTARHDKAVAGLCPARIVKR
jgi:hypothetical protein